MLTLHKSVMCLAILLTGSMLRAAAERRTQTTAPAAANPAATRPAADRAALAARIAPVIARGLKFQVAGQREDGGWPGPTEQSDPAISAIVLQGLIQDSAYGPDHPAVKRGLDFLLKWRQPDGGIYDPKMGYLNYTTSVAVMALAATRSPTLQSPLDASVKFLKDNQWIEGKCDDDGKDITPSHVWYGGAGYGHHKRPDLSNTQFMLDALRASGLPADDPAYQKALKFVQRCQMLAATNDQPFAAGANDGGFIYTPANGGQSMADTTEVDGRTRLRSYGSMTYAGFKSMIYANVSRDDPRVQAAYDWIRRYYTLDENPNMPGAGGKQGLYYYYHTYAKALEAWGEPVIIDVKGVPHDWRSELTNKLIALQRPDGSWINEADRWMEGNPYLVTAYAALSLQLVLR